jgi:hypothetical protein
MTLKITNYLPWGTGSLKFVKPEPYTCHGGEIAAVSTHGLHYEDPVPCALGRLPDPATQKVVKFSHKNYTFILILISKGFFHDPFTNLCMSCVANL